MTELPRRDVPALIEALRIRALALTGAEWERTATRDMMKEAAQNLEDLWAALGSRGVQEEPMTWLDKQAARERAGWDPSAGSESSPATVDQALIEVIQWALGESETDEFPGLPDDWPRRKFYWRDELRRRFEAATALRGVEKEPMTEQTMADAAEMLWVVLANVSGGDWTKQSQEWQDAAARWRDNYFRVLKAVPLDTPHQEEKATK